MGEESETASASADLHLLHKIAKILNETRTSYATHNRKLKELAALRSKLSPSDPEDSSPIPRFSSLFFKTLTPLFVAAQRRTAAAERIVRFVAEFACLRSNSDGAGSECDDEFLDEFLRFLIPGSVAANRNARFRACHIISEVLGFLLEYTNGL